LAITGSPPFGPFLSELKILKAALDQGHPLVAALYLTFLAVIFIGMATSVLKMVQGEPTGGLSGALLKGKGPHLWGGGRREPILAVLPPLALGSGVLLLGLYIPPVLSSTIEQAARMLGGF